MTTSSSSSRSKMDDAGGIDSLPNEILLSILDTFPTNRLTSLLTINKRLHTLVARILSHRLLSTASLPDNELILECYHPCAKISTPYLACEYLGLRAPSSIRRTPAEHQATPPPASHPGTDDGGGGPGGEGRDLASLSQLYSAFRPTLIEDNRSRRGIWFSKLEDVTYLPPGHQNGRRRRRSSRFDDTATQDVLLEEGDVFSQLCVTTSVVKEGPRKGFFVNHVNVSEGGVIRVWRKWLLQRAAETHDQWDDGGDGQESEVRNILWADAEETVGLKFSVQLGPAQRMPILSGPGEDDFAVQYKLTYEELWVRTSKLLLAVERGLLQDPTHHPQAIIIAPS